MVPHATRLADELDPAAAAVQQAPASPVQVATQTDQLPAAQPEPASQTHTTVPSEQPVVPAKRPTAPRISELKPEPSASTGEGLFNEWVTGKIIDYPLGVQFEDYRDLDFSEGYNRCFKRREARVSSIVENWLETVARHINKTSRASGRFKHQSDARMRANAVLRTALERGLLDLKFEGAVDEATLREMNGLPPAPEQMLFDRELAEKMREQLDESTD